jgi:hypothetical protein
MFIIQFMVVGAPQFEFTPSCGIIQPDYEETCTVVNFRPNIWQLQSQRDIQGLIDSLQYSDAEVRKRAAVALRTLDATQAVPALKAALERETDEQTRSHLATAVHVLDHRTDVTGLMSRQDVNSLIKVLKSRHIESVIAAAKALGKLNDRTAVEPLVILFQNSSAPPRARLAAAEALLELKSAPAVVTLLGALRRDSWQVRRNAAAVLGQIQATWAIEPLTAALNDQHPVVRRTAVAALRRIGTVEAIAALRNHFAQRPTETTAPVPLNITPPPAPLPPAIKEKVVVKPEEQPVQTPEPSPSEPPAPPPAVDEPEQHPSRITRPVMKLIAFLKPRSDT